MIQAIHAENATGPSLVPTVAPIRVLGVGGAGCRVVERLEAEGLSGAGFVAMNTDAAALRSCGVAHQIQLGARLSRGLGAGGDPEIGRAAVEEAAEAVREACRGAELVFVVAGMGGGTGTGAAPLAARYAREAGALVLGVATLPFTCEGARRLRQARLGVEELRSVADVVLTLPNQRVLSLIDENTSLVETFRFTDALLAEGVRGVWRILGRPGLINVDFADLREMTRDRHAESYFACAEAEGEARSREVVERLVLSPLLENGNLLRETGSALASLVAGPSLTMAEVDRVSELLRRECEGGELLLGATIDPAMGDRLSLMLIGLRRQPKEGEWSVGAAGGAADPAEWEAGVAESGFPERQAGTRRTRSRFLPPPPELSTAAKQAVAGGVRRGRSGPRQAMLPLEVLSKGRFEKSEPTVYRGADLDVPTFVRRGVVLN
jgi:cell division protein FtsZ